MEDIFSPIPYAAVLAVLIVGVISLVIARTRRRTSIKLMAGHDPSDILLVAEDVNLAEYSVPGAHATGNGTLLLTREELAFRNWDGQSVRIPLRAIQRIEGTRLTMKGTNMRPLLRIYFSGDTGDEARAGWLVQGAEEWAYRIERERSS